MTEPRLRFAEFTDEWKVLKLSDIADRINRKNTNNETDLPLTISSLVGLVDQRAYFNKIVASKDISGYYLLKNGEFAYNKSYSAGYDYGSIKRLDMYDMGALSTLYICFSLKDTEQSDFIVKYFDSQKWYKEVYAICAEGARNHGLLNVSVNDFFNMEICLPKDKKEEKKILELLVSIDNVISAIELEIALWKEKKKGVIQKIFSQEVRFKKEDGSDYSEWEERTFSDVFESLEYGMNTAAADYDGVNKYIRITDIDDGSHRYSTNNIVSPSGKLNDKYLVNENDILFARTGASTGKSYLYRQEDGKLYFAGFLIRGHVKSNFNSYFIFVQTLTEQYDKWVRVMSIRSGQAGINATEYALFKFMCPCFEEQNKIAELLSTVDEVIQSKHQKLETWKNIRKGLLQQMFV